MCQDDEPMIKQDFWVECLEEDEAYLFNSFSPYELLMHWEKSWKKESLCRRTSTCEEKSRGKANSNIKIKIALNDQVLAT